MVWIFAATLCFTGSVFSQEEAEAAPPIEEPEAISKPEDSAETDASEPKAIAAPDAGAGAEAESAAEPKLSPEEARAEMLERIADNLSKRMRALADRERLAGEREKALAEREEALKEREALLEARENVVRRREKLPPPQAWDGPAPPNVVGKYAAVIDGRTMQFYYQKDAKTKTPVASTQKLMTALIICTESDLDEEIEIPEAVLHVEPTVIGVKPGERYKRRDLLRALLVRSGNDIAATLAIDNAGSIEAFADKMNEFARSLGMDTTHFINPHGLPAEGQYSCAHDIALVAFEAYQNADIREMVKTRQCIFTFNDGSTRDLYNTNRVLSSSEYCNGMKTGFTYASGHCLVCSGEKDGQDRIVVVIKSYKPYVWSDSEKLLDWALDLDVHPVAEDKVAAIFFP
ncbi:MAG: serine hydrolase [Verrucomicrobiae bacterium]|nr:serine hydrolase [Verrucomicrobiae bacterium]